MDRSLLVEESDFDDGCTVDEVFAASELVKAIFAQRKRVVMCYHDDVTVIRDEARHFIDRFDTEQKEVSKFPQSTDYQLRSQYFFVFFDAFAIVGGFGVEFFMSYSRRA
eukprot:scaffold1958_cov198-Alexandrium_tamarense.AAC.1